MAGESQTFSPKVSNGKFLQPLELGDETDMMRWHIQDHTPISKNHWRIAAIPKNLVTFILLLPRKKLYALGFFFFVVWFFICRKSHQKLEIHTPPKSRPQFEAAMFGLSQKTSGARGTGTVLSLKFSEVNFNFHITIGMILLLSRFVEKWSNLTCPYFFQMGWEKKTPTRITYIY